MQEPTILLYITASGRAEAETIARTLLAERLIACANLLPGVTSLYWWEGAVQEGQECVVIGKTTEERIDTVTSRVKELHSYACPCVVALAITGGNPEFLRWIGGEVGQDAISH